MVIKGKVYDVTNFLAKHPGGKRAILRFAGKDASEDFEMIHPPGTLETLDPTLCLGDAEEMKKMPKSTADESCTKSPLPGLESMVNLDDFAKTAQQVISDKGWAYYYSASDDLITKNYNNEIYRKVLLRPRIFKDVATVSTASSILGVATSLPIFVSPAAIARLAHPSGEKGIAHACGVEGIVQMISNNASMKFEDIVSDPIVPTQKFCFQLYVQTDKSVSEKTLQRVVSTGRCHAIVLTLDAPTPGKREADERIKNDGATFSGSSGLGKIDKSEGLGRALFAGTSASLIWEDLQWLRSQIPTDMPIILKGLQTYEDAVLAAKSGVTLGIPIQPFKDKQEGVQQGILPGALSGSIDDL